MRAHLRTTNHLSLLLSLQREIEREEREKEGRREKERERQTDTWKDRKIWTERPAGGKTDSKSDRWTDRRFGLIDGYWTIFLSDKTIAMCTIDRHLINSNKKIVQ